MKKSEYFNKWVLPLFWESPLGNPPFNYYGSTGVRLFWGNQHFFVTANHEVDGFDCNNLCVPQDAKTLDTIPLSEKINVESRLFDREFKDICFFRIVESSKNNASPNLENVVIESDLIPGEELLVLGYPIESNYFEEGKFHFHQACYEAHFTLKINDNRSRISIDLPDGKSLQGFSGGPVLRKRDLKICGMMIKGDDNGLAEFYDARIIAMCLDRIVNG